MTRAPEPAARPPHGRRKLYGLLAEFDGPQRLQAAVERARDAGYRAMDAYTPFPVEGVAEALGARGRLLPPVALAGGLAGMAGGYFLQYYASVVAYPLDVGGRPFHSWPAFVPITFELTILGAALATVLGMLALNGLPMPYHPLFNVPEFELASRSRFFLCIEARDARFDPTETRRFLESLAPRRVFDVEP